MSSPRQRTKTVRIPKQPRVLLVTPEITYLPEGMGNLANRLTAKAGGLADVSASLVAALFQGGADVHVAVPHYRRMFGVNIGSLVGNDLQKYREYLPDSRLHLAEDRAFYYRDSVYCQNEGEKLALAFQREVINNIIPRVNPDLIHCNDWMTGLIPAMARRLCIPCLFTVHNIHTHKLTLETVEDAGIDAADFWRHLYFERQPINYEETRSNNGIDLLASGLFAAHYINTVSPTFLQEIVDGQHNFVPPPVRGEMAHKVAAGAARGILNAPDPVYDSQSDPYLPHHYGPDDHPDGKRACKAEFQRHLHLDVNEQAPLLFWPSRLDPVQKGCQLLTDQLFALTADYAHEHLQIAIVANGSYQRHFHDIVNRHNLHGQVAVTDFSEGLSHLGYAASDFMLMPSRFEPCGLPQMISAKYGSLPIVHDTGGLHDTVHHLNVETDSGNGFVFQHYDTAGLRWAIDEALRFYRRPDHERRHSIARIMRDSSHAFSHDVTAEHYFEIYQAMLNRPIVPRFDDGP